MDFCFGYLIYALRVVTFSNVNETSKVIDANQMSFQFKHQFENKYINPSTWNPERDEERINEIINIQK